MTPTVTAVILAVAGGILGLLADRLAARWPRHEDGRVRAVDWRTAVMIVAGTLAFAALGLRWTEPRELILLGAYFVALTVLMATDLDQRLLPDIITLPLIPAALAVLLLGWDPLLAGKEHAVVSGIATGIAAPALLILTNVLLKGGLGMGDLKLAVSLGFLCGVSRFFAGFLLASAASSAVLIALLATRRIGLRSTIPFGPVLITGGFVAALLP